MVAQRGVEMSYLSIPGLNNFVIFRLYIEIVLNNVPNQAQQPKSTAGFSNRSPAKQSTKHCTFRDMSVATLCTHGRISCRCMQPEIKLGNESTSFSSAEADNSATALRAARLCR